VTGQDGQRPHAGRDRAHQGRPDRGGSDAGCSPVLSLSTFLTSVGLSSPRQDDLKWLGLDNAVLFSDSYIGDQYEGLPEFLGTEALDNEGPKDDDTFHAVSEVTAISNGSAYIGLPPRGYDPLPGKHAGESRRPWSRNPDDFLPHRAPVLSFDTRQDGLTKRLLEMLSTAARNQPSVAEIFPTEDDAATKDVENGIRMRSRVLQVRPRGVEGVGRRRGAGDLRIGRGQSTYGVSW
jgi:hypothetical protein